MINYSRKTIIEDFHKIATSDEDKRKHLLNLINQIKANPPSPSASNRPAAPVRTGPSEADRKLIQEYKELLENWESFKEYVHPELEALGNKIVETIVGPVKNEIEKTEPIDGVNKNDLDREQALEDWQKNANDINIMQDFSKTSGLSKITSNVDSEEVYLNFEKKVDESTRVFKEKFAYVYNDVTQREFTSLYELALAHHLLTSEGLHKEASQIDLFVKTSGFWDSVGSSLRGAWDTTKEVVSSGVKILGKGVELIGDGFRWAGGMVLKGLKYLGKAFPVIGLIFSVPFFIKNLLEAIENGRRIFKELPLEKYGWSPMGCVTDFGHVTKTFDEAIEKYIRSPEDIKVIVTIFKTIGAFWVDTLFAITNGILALLDLIALISAIVAAVGGPIGWLAAIGALGGSFLVNAAFISLELSGDYFKSSVWSAHLDGAKKRIVKEVNQIVENSGSNEQQIMPEAQPVTSPTQVGLTPETLKGTGLPPMTQKDLEDLGFYDLKSNDPLVQLLGDSIVGTKAIA